jgi:hypothetical protein
MTAMWIELAKLLWTCIEGGAPVLVTIAFVMGLLLAKFIFGG